jgi:hypothetical protein
MDYQRIGWVAYGSVHPTRSRTFSFSKLLVEIDRGHTTEAILLTHNSADTRWFHLAASGTLACYKRGRIAFTDENGKKCAPTQGQTFFYYGPHPEEFYAQFADQGMILLHGKKENPKHSLFATPVRSVEELRETILRDALV